MAGWADGDLEADFEQRLDGLLAELSPGWRPAELPEPYRNDERFVAYNRRNAKRTRLGELLATQPEVAIAVADRVLDVIACDEDGASNRQLVHPLVIAVGRRMAQRYLIRVIESGPEHKKVCAVRAWYWSQVSLVYESVEALRERRPTPASRATAVNASPT